MKLISDFLLVSGVVMIVIILIILLKTKPRTMPARILSAFFALLLLVCLHFYADLHGISWLYVSTLLFNDMAAWVIGPLLLVYIKSLFSKTPSLWLNNWPHFIPAGLYLLLVSLPLWFSVIRQAYVFDYLAWLLSYGSVQVLLRDGYMLCYLAWSLRLFYRLRLAMKSQYSSLTQQNVGWIKHLLLGCGLLIAIDSLTELYEMLWGDMDFNTGYITVFLMVLFVAYLGYYGTLQTQFLLPELSAEVIGDQPPKTQRVPILSSEEVKQLQGRLNRVLVNDKPYLDENLTLNKLAVLVATRDKKLSALLNQHLNTSFYQLINDCRVREVCERLSSPQYLNQGIMAVAYQCGFNSKTTFNRLFKAATGCSPSQYRAQQNKSQHQAG